MSSFSDLPSEIDCDTTSGDLFNDHQWYSTMASLMDTELNASNNMAGRHSHEEPTNPFSSPNDVTATYNEDTIMGLNDTSVPNESTAENK